MSATVKHQFEYEQRIRCAFIGAGGHSYRNVYPTFQYAPVDLLAVCDLNAERAAAFARIFGARRHYSDHREMLAREEPEAVFIVTGYQPDGRVQATELAIECLQAGAHVWMEKPAAASVAEIKALQEASDRAGRFVLVGLKKIFTPAMTKVHEVMTREEFGPVSSISVRFPQALPAPERRHDTSLPADVLRRVSELREKSRAGDANAAREFGELAGVEENMLGFLDHIYHPAAILTHLLGPVRRFSHEWEPLTGSSVASLRFSSGAVGTLHLAAGIASTSPLERVEVVGRDANVVVENGVRVTYYRPGADDRFLLQYADGASYVVDDAVAPLTWEPEFSLGGLSTNSLFTLGYVPEVIHFCESVLSGKPPCKGTLENALAIMQLYEAYQRVPPGVVAALPLDAEAS